MKDNMVKDLAYRIIDLMRSSGMHDNTSMIEISKMILLIASDKDVRRQLHNLANDEKEFMNYYEYSLRELSYEFNYKELKDYLMFNSRVLSKPLIETFMILSQIIDLCSSSENYDELNYTMIYDFYNFMCLNMISNLKVGIYPTPRYLIDFMVKLVRPSPNSSVLDFACGTGAFLSHISSQFKLEEFSKFKLVGFDVSVDMLFFARIYTIIHGKSDPDFEVNDLFDDNNRDSLGEYDIILSNPPAALKTDRSNVFSRSETISLIKSISYLREGGRAALLVPDVLLKSNSMEYVRAREILIEETDHVMVVSLPVGTLEPYTKGKASIITFCKDTTKKTHNKVIKFASLSKTILQLDRFDYMSTDDELLSILDCYWGEVEDDSANSIKINEVSYKRLDENKTLINEFYYTEKFVLEDLPKFDNVIADLIKTEKDILNNLEKLAEELNNNE